VSYIKKLDSEFILEKDIQKRIEKVYVKIRTRGGSLKIETMQYYVQFVHAVYHIKAKEKLCSGLKGNTLG
jgi:hypothetical protein